MKGIVVFHDVNANAWRGHRWGQLSSRSKYFPQPAPGHKENAAVSSLCLL
jgi:hypothetical protein